MPLFFGEQDLHYVEGAWGNRWKQLHSPLHAVGYVLDPEYVDHKDVFAEVEISEGVQKVFEKLAPGDVDKCMNQLRMYRAKEGSFSKPSIWLHAKGMNAYAFWELFGAELGELRSVAMKVLAQPVTTSAAERNWSAYEFVHSKKRNKLSAARCNDLVYVFSNLRLANKLRDPYFKEQVMEWGPDDSSSEEDDVDVEGDMDMESDPDPSPAQVRRPSRLAPSKGVAPLPRVSQPSRHAPQAVPPLLRATQPSRHAPASQTRLKKKQKR